MSKNLSLSIVIPVYNAENYISNSIDMLVGDAKNSNVDLEIVLINDASTDSSAKIMCDMAKKYSCVKNIFSEVNQGAGASRMIGVYQATKEYLFFLDIDDALESNTLKVIEKKVAACPESDLFIFPFNKIFEGQDESKKKFSSLGIHEYIKRTNKNSNILAKDDLSIYKIGHIAWNKIYKTQFFKDNNLYFLPYYNGLLLSYKSVHLAKNITLIEEPLVLYWQRKDCISQDTKTKKCMRLFVMYDIVEDYLRNYVEYFSELAPFFFIKVYDDCIYTFNRINPEARRKFFKEMRRKVLKNKKYIRPQGKREKLIFLFIKLGMCKTLYWYINKR